jgi:hypothetical protein
MRQAADISARRSLCSSNSSLIRRRLISANLGCCHVPGGGVGAGGGGNERPFGVDVRVRDAMLKEGDRS